MFEKVVTEIFSINVSYLTPHMERYQIVEMELLAWWYRGHIRE